MIKVSVEIITYNQEKYIAQALDSALMQQTRFDYEIVVGEDCSTDCTRDIVIDYKKQYPDKIRAILHPENVGERMNDVQTLQACRGQYVAVLEGDDFWTSPYKLQRQVDLLDRHTDYAICCHNAHKVAEDGTRELGLYVPADQKETLTLADLFAINPIPTASVMFRRDLLDQFPDWYWSVPFGDWALWLILAQRGKVAYVNEVMCAYRVHGKGIYSALNTVQQLQHKIEFLEVMGANLDVRYRRMIKRSKSLHRHDLARAYERSGNLADARAQATACVAEYPLNVLWCPHKLLALFTKLYAPWWYELVYASSRSILRRMRHKRPDARLPT